MPFFFISNYSGEYISVLDAWVLYLTTSGGKKLVVVEMQFGISTSLALPLSLVKGYFSKIQMNDTLFSFFLFSLDQGLVYGF